MVLQTDLPFGNPDGRDCADFLKPVPPGRARVTLSLEGPGADFSGALGDQGIPPVLPISLPVGRDLQRVQSHCSVPV